MVFKITIAVFGIILTSLISYGAYKYNQFTSIITNQEIEIKNLVNNNNALHLEVQVMKINEDELKKAIRDQNEKYTSLYIENENNIQRFQEWKKKADNEKYKNAKLNNLLTQQKAKTCEDGLQLNKEISTLRYEDL